jgi:hypothetical protein
MRLLPLALISLLLTCSVHAEDLRARGWLHLDGYTHHFNAPDANDDIFGLGFTWYNRQWDQVVGAWETDVFRDSGCRLSAYAGYSWTYRTNAVNVGITGALMYHCNFAAQNRLRVLPVGLPFAELPLKKFSLRAYYIPPVRSRTDQQIAFQVLVPFAR